MNNSNDSRLSSPLRCTTLFCVLDHLFPAKPLSLSLHINVAARVLCIDTPIYFGRQSTPFGIDRWAYQPGS